MVRFHLGAPNVCIRICAWLVLLIVAHAALRWLWLESEKEKCLLSLLEISKEVSALTVRLEFIEKENEILKIELQK